VSRITQSSDGDRKRDEGQVSILESAVVRDSLVSGHKTGHRHMNCVGDSVSD
jgi:hypothetical protein